MSIKKFIGIYMDSPLYLTMPLRMRLDLIRRHPSGQHHTGLREDLLHWVKTGNFDPLTRGKQHRQD